MQTPKTADPIAWAKHNERIAALSPEQYAQELQDPGCDVLAYTVAELTPSAELITQVLTIAAMLDRGAAPGACADMLRSAVGLEAE